VGHEIKSIHSCQSDVRMNTNVRLDDVVLVSSVRLEDLPTDDRGKRSSCFTRTASLSQYLVFKIIHGLPYRVDTFWDRPSLFNVTILIQWGRKRKVTHKLRIESWPTADLSHLDPLPEITARMNNPGVSLLLPSFLTKKCITTSKQFHG